jgi:hypothetical protein
MVIEYSIITSIFLPYYLLQKKKEKEKRKEHGTIQVSIATREGEH